MDANRGDGLALPSTVIAALRAALPAMANQTLAAIDAEVPSYIGALEGTRGVQIEQAVQMALGGFLKLAARPEGTDPSLPLKPALDAAYGLGRGEARSGRTMDALLAAYRVGARVAWRELAAVALNGELPAPTLAQFAELVFAYIDELSAASVAGHAAELANTGQVRQRQLDRLTRGLLLGDPADTLLAAAARAGWRPPQTLTALLLPSAQRQSLRTIANVANALLVDDLPELTANDDTALLIPDLSPAGRSELRSSLAGSAAVLGPPRPWLSAAASYERALRARQLPPPDNGIVDTEEHLAELIVGADPDAHLDLRSQILAPLADLRPAVAEKLAETLRAWLLHQGRREEIAAALFVHPQTIRYRMGQLREMYGAKLDDPRFVLNACIALGASVRTE